MRIYPVIHFVDVERLHANIETAQSCGAHGVFLISHHGQNTTIITAAMQLRRTLPQGFHVGFNLLGRPGHEAARVARNMSLDMVWMDQAGVSSAGVTDEARRIHQPDDPVDVFASVAFKYQPDEPDPAEAARVARAQGWIPTTSGRATGLPPRLEKIQQMSDAAEGVLAVASGMDPGNVSLYAPHLSHILVSTGVSDNAERLDPDKLSRLIERAT